MSIKFFNNIRCTYKCLHYITNNTNNFNTKIVTSKRLYQKIVTSKRMYQKIVTSKRMYQKIVTSKRMYQKRLNWIDLPRHSKVRRPPIFKKANNFAHIKGALSDLKQFLATESPVKMMKNAFYFTSKDPFVLKVFTFLF